MQTNSVEKRITKSALMAYRLCGQSFLPSDHRHDTSWRNLTSSCPGFSSDRNTRSLYWGSLYDELRQASEILGGRGQGEFIGRAAQTMISIRIINSGGTEGRPMWL